MDKSVSKVLSGAIILFILLDLSVPATNLWIADEMAQYAVSINMAGRQRMLTQRITKTLLQLEHAEFTSTNQALEEELNKAARQFDQVLNGFASGGMVDSGAGLVELHPANAHQTEQLIHEALKIWKPIRENILPSGHGVTATEQDVIALAKTQMLKSNLRLLDLMNQLTYIQEQKSIKRVDRLRSVQIIVFVLSLIIFLVIVRRLHELTRHAFGLGRHFEELATRDSLTGLRNRREFNVALEREYASAKRKNDGMAVLLMDLDGFKQVNDTHGHDAGDKVLRDVATRMTEMMRTNDTIARMGGDEFVIICPDMSDESSAATFSQRLIDNINLPITIGATDVHVGASVGITFYSDHIHGPDELIKLADQAMYAAKFAGRNRYMFASSK